MFKRLAIIALCASLTACGGGNSSAPTSPPDIVIGAALMTSVQTPPEASKPFTGAFAGMNGASVGWIDGTSAEDVAKSIALNVAQNPDKWPNEYKAMLSDAGLSIVVFGQSTSVPDMHYVAKMGKGNVIDVVRV